MLAEIEWSRLLLFVGVLVLSFVVGATVFELRSRSQRETARSAGQKLILALFTGESRYFTRKEIWQHLGGYLANAEYSVLDMDRDLSLLSDEGKLEPQMYWENLRETNELRYRRTP